MRFRAILLFGPPGAGKGTQGKILGKIPNFIHFACGEAFRNLRMDSGLGRVFLQYSGGGHLVPDEPTIQLWKASIDGMIGTGQYNPEADTLILDGIPRNANQALLMRDLIDVKGIFNLFCPELDKMIVRLQRRALRENRLDDVNVEVIRARLETYKRETRAVLECYPEHVIHQIDSTQEPILVLLQILEVVAKIPKPTVKDGDMKSPVEA